MSDDQGQMPAISSSDTDEMEDVPLRKKSKTEGQGQAGNKNPEQRKKYESLVDTSFFNELVGKEQFVDKTATMSEMFGEIGDGVILTAPSRFGKTVMISMFRLFMERKSDADGERLAKELNTNFKLFEDLAIAKDEKFVDEHFGRYPVIHIELKSQGEIFTYEDASRSLKLAIHETYCQHDYLLKSNRVTVENPERQFKQILELWIGSITSENASVYQVLLALPTLARMLFIHHNEQCFVLVDEYDSILDQALGCMTYQTLKRICMLITDTVSRLFKGNGKQYVKGGIMTGISHLCGLATSGSINNIRRCGFQKNHKFRNFFGLTQLEVESLLNTFNLKDRLGDVLNRFNGYIGKDEVSLYNPWSTYNFVVTKHLTDCWATGRAIKGLKSSFQVESLKFKIWKLIDGGSIAVKIFTSLNVEQLQKLNLLLSGHPEELEETDEHLVLNMFFEQGFLTVDHTPGELAETMELKIPNEGTRRLFIDDLMVYCRSIYKIPIAECKTRFLKICKELNEIEEKVKANMIAFLGSLKQLLCYINKDFKGFQELNLHVAVAMVFHVITNETKLNPSVTKEAKCPTNPSSRKGLFTKPDLYIYLKDFKLCVLIELKHNQNVEQAAEQLHNNRQLKIVKESGDFTRATTCLILAIASRINNSGLSITALHDIRKVPEALKYCDDVTLLNTLDTVGKQRVNDEIEEFFAIDATKMPLTASPPDETPRVN